MGLTTFKPKITGAQNKFIEKNKNILIKNSYKTITNKEDLANIINIIKEIGFLLLIQKQILSNLIMLTLSVLACLGSAGEACYIPLAHSENQLASAN